MSAGRLHIYRASSSFLPTLYIHSTGTPEVPLVKLPESDAQPQPQPPEVKGVKKIRRACSSALVIILKGTVVKVLKKRALKNAHKKAHNEELAKQR